MSTTHKGEDKSMSSAVQILDIAERRMREAGYNAVSFRDIAAEMGIKSASLHYHFPKKVDLGTALVQRYSDRFFDALEKETATISSPDQMIAAYVALYRFALMEQKLVCLCAVLGAEARGLPDAVTEHVNRFYTDNITWLSACYLEMGRPHPDDRAKAVFSMLEGAMIVSAVNKDPSVFEAAVTTIAAL